MERIRNTEHTVAAKQAVDVAVEISDDGLVLELARHCPRKVDLSVLLSEQDRILARPGLYRPEPLGAS